MKKTSYFLILLFAASVIFTGCRNDDYEPEIPEAIVVADPESLEQTVSADEKTGASTVEFTTQASWTSSIAKVPTTQSTRDASEMWASISPESGGTGTYEIEISLLPNTTGANRTVIITITSGDENIQIRITQRYVRADGTIAVIGVTLPEHNTELTVGETETLIATVLPANATNQNVTWSTSDAAIADVDADGVVTAVSVGTATITATTVEGAHTATATVVVEPIVVTGVTLLEHNTELTVGETETLIATVFPTNATNQNITWSTSDAAIADVDADGVVTAVSVGTATITVTTEDGGRTAAAEITVTPIGIGSPTATTDPGVLIGEFNGNPIRWATRNVNTPGTFADNPEDAGMFFQWNRRTGWVSTGYEWPNFPPGWNSSLPTGTRWETANDPCPAGWRVPIHLELYFLNNAGSTWTTLSGVNGRLYGTAPNQIFLPAVGGRFHSDGTLGFAGTGGGYWSSTQPVSTYAWGLWFDSGISHVYVNWRADGFSVRCVAE